MKYPRGVVNNLIGGNWVKLLNTVMGKTYFWPYRIYRHKGLGK